MFVIHIPTMQLQNELPAGDKPLIFITPMPAGASQEPPVPGTAGLDVVNADEGRKFHVKGPYAA